MGAYDPLEIFARKQKVGEEHANSVVLQMYIHLDAAKRGQCDNAGANLLAIHLIAASYIAQQTRSRAFHAQVAAAYNALKKASDRPTKLLDLTTSEYKVIRAAFNTYLAAMPEMEIGTLSDAHMIAHEKLK